MTMKITNNGSTTLAANITNVATSLSVAPGEGALFPTISGSEYFMATLVDSSNNIEIVKVTARSTDTFTIVRAQEGTTARAFTSGDKVEGRLTAAEIESLTLRIKQVVKQVFTSSGTYTPSSGMAYCIIECIGGGGGGGGAHVGATSRSHGANGGGGGAYSRLLASAATIGSSQAVTVGAAGSAGISGSGSGTPGDGSNGGTSSVGSLCTAPGGNGGGRGWITSLIQPPTGGAAGVGDISIPGDAGGAGFYQTTAGGTVLLPTGKGGDGPFGGGAPGVIANSGGATGKTPLAGSYGAGGSGAGANNGVAYATGGDGHAGIVVITEFIV